MCHIAGICTRSGNPMASSRKSIRLRTIGHEQPDKYFPLSGQSQAKASIPNSSSFSHQAASEGKERYHRSRTRSSHLALACEGFCSLRIHKTTDKHRWAWSTVLHGRILDRSEVIQVEAPFLQSLIYSCSIGVG